MIRQFIPKGIDIARFSNVRIKETEDFINNYPRKILDGFLPIWQSKIISLLNIKVSLQCDTLYIAIERIWFSSPRFLLFISPYDRISLNLLFFRYLNLFLWYTNNKNNELYGGIMAKITNFYFWKTLIGIVTGSIVGTLISEAASNARGLSWLSYGQSIGISPPFGIDLGFLSFTFGITLSINLAVIICILIFVLLFRKIF